MVIGGDERTAWRGRDGSSVAAVYV